MAVQLLDQPPAQPEATLDDLLRYEGKAELINGSLVPLMATGRIPNKVAGNIFRSLADFADAQGGGEPYTDNIAFAVPKLSSGRRSFSPDASFFVGESPGDPMKYVQGPPTFAVEVRSENDYNASADIAMRDKRAEYFEAGTVIVWDVDPLARVIRSYHRDRPQVAVEFRNGDIANAEEAIPGWRIAVQAVFRNCPDLTTRDLC